MECVLLVVAQAVVVIGALPPTLKLGARLAWRKATVLSWLAQKENITKS